jgi:hypothetical protein
MPMNLMRPNTQLALQGVRENYFQRNTAERNDARTCFGHKQVGDLPVRRGFDVKSELLIFFRNNITIVIKRKSSIIDCDGGRRATTAVSALPLQLLTPAAPSPRRAPLALISATDWIYPEKPASSRSAVFARPPPSEHYNPGLVEPPSSSRAKSIRA